ncbi:DUF3891 family protein [Alkalibacillus haloalkaliphilus]|uniref:DUF3891 family protein n=1 Tax=Alkalibacillus haloalkaliphilus TaxID=94136 RepID=UPI002935E53E|nr:DUF3891 family protein [Alkalibacillus haloalkaliphilus]MDV2583283.1 DUF3891 family protein [Alkalibacillus haloalkaliphilus]
MIVTSSNTHFKMITQHDHALVSGELAKNWSDSIFEGGLYRKEVEYAVSQHDCAWIPLDKHPTWNEEKDQPHSFMDYPLEPKVEHYRKGIGLVENQSEYAALLCSQHYLSFFDQNSTNSTITDFISQEMIRQDKIKRILNIQVPEEYIDFHFRLLQFCDDLSLYLCLNEPGTAKEGENPMFKDGFRQQFSGIKGTIKAKWLDEQIVSVSPNPFKNPFKVEIPYKAVSKEDCEARGLQQAYDLTPNELREVYIR